jgi:hypothetical protein
MRHRNFAWSSLGLPDPDSPAGRHFDWSAVGMPNPHSPAGKHFDYSQHREWGNAVLDWGMRLPGWGKWSAATVLEEILKFRGVEVSVQMALLRHYVRGSAEPYDLNKNLGGIPEAWQVWIVNATKGIPGTHPHINGEEAQVAGLDDLSDSLGHFTVVVSEKSGTSAKIYEIKKEGKEQYQFGSTPHDPERRHRHGCRIPLPDSWVSFLRSHLMPTRMYDYGHSKWDEQFNLAWRRIGKTNRWAWHLDLPWYVMVKIGKPFNVYGKFER